MYPSEIVPSVCQVYVQGYRSYSSRYYCLIPVIKTLELENINAQKKLNCTIDKMLFIGDRKKAET